MCSLAEKAATAGKVTSARVSSGVKSEQARACMANAMHYSAGAIRDLNKQACTLLEADEKQLVGGCGVGLAHLIMANAVVLLATSQAACSHQRGKLAATYVLAGGWLMRHSKRWMHPDRSLANFDLLSTITNTSAVATMSGGPPNGRSATRPHEKRAHPRPPQPNPQVPWGSTA